MANKQYTSIIRLFNYCGISTDEDFNLPRTKKQLQAEFGIAQGGFIEVDGYTYTRHDVFEELERPNFPARLKFHRQIWNAPPLLELLENNTVDFTTIRDGFRAFWNDKEFDEFFSPYFAGPFNYISRTLLTDTRLREMGDLLVYEDFLQPDEREEAFRPLRIFLDENLRLLRNINRENYNMMRPKIIHWIDEDWHGFFNGLPNEFYEIKTDMVVRLINIGVAVQKSHRSDCRQMSEQLISLSDTPESLRQTIVSNHAVYSGSSRTGSANFRGVFWIGWLIIIIVRAANMGGCGDDHSDYQQYFNNDYNKYQVDSLIRGLKDTHPTISADTAILPTMRDRRK